MNWASEVTIMIHEYLRMSFEYFKELSDDLKEIEKS